MTNRAAKIQLLSRINRGKAALPSFLAGLSQAIGEPIGVNALLPLPESDILMESFRNGYQCAIKAGALSYRRFFVEREAGLVLRLADCLADRLPTEPAFFLTKVSENCGVVSVNVSALLRHAKSIIQFDGDSLSATSLDGSQGLLIDHNPDDYKQTYEVSVWGDQWALRALECNP